MNKTKTITEILTEARDLVANGWTQEVSARDSMGEPVSASDVSACSYCSMGAIYHSAGVVERYSYNDYNANRAIYAMRMLENVIANDDEWLIGVVDWNDNLNRTQEEVVAAFDKAIMVSKTEEPA